MPARMAMMAMTTSNSMRVNLLPIIFIIGSWKKNKEVKEFKEFKEAHFELETLNSLNFLNFLKLNKNLTLNPRRKT